VQELTDTSEKLRLDLGVALNDAKTQLAAEVQAQFADMTNFNIISAHDQFYSKSYCTLLGSLPERIKQVIRESRKITRAKRVLQILLFEEIKQREDQIHDAYAKTFSWIFEEETTSFKRWLTSGNGTFWVNGKAGSGKSTLMKFLANHENTRILLRRWSGSEDLVVASFYFWAAGHETQKTQLGLMKTLLYQILRQCPELIPFVLPSRFSNGNIAGVEADSWTRQELSSAVDSIITQHGLKSKFCFFIDGLDEYSDVVADEYQTLIQYLDHLTESSNVKLCVSSRPWNPLKDHYGTCDKLKFVLQDLTSEDMLKYARGLLQQNKRFQSLAIREPRALSLAIQIRDKAEGVFLWVHLVTQSLKRGLSEHDDTKELERRLAQTPSDLVEFFRSIFRNIDDSYKDYTMRALQIAAIALPMPLSAFQYIPQELEDHTYATKQITEVRTYANRHGSDLGKPEVDLLGIVPLVVSEAETRVNKWCRDLLEVHHDPDEWEQSHYPIIAGQVQFLHRTVKDFLLTPEMQNLFLQNDACASSPRKAVCRMYLAYTKSCCSIPSQNLPGSPYSLEVNTKKILHWAKQCEVYDQVAPIDILEELGKTRHTAKIVGRFQGGSQESMLRLAVQEGLSLYVDSMPGRDVRAEPGIFWRALFPSWDESVQDPESLSRENLAMISKLIDKGCNPNDGWSDDDDEQRRYMYGSVWQKLMGILYRPDPANISPRTQSHWPHRALEALRELIDIPQLVAFMLIHGANPNARFRSFGQRGTTHTRAFLMQVFNGEEAKVDALQKEARKVRAAALANERGLFAGFVEWSAQTWHEDTLGMFDRDNTRDRDGLRWYFNCYFSYENGETLYALNL
jgi:hypothetical protein